MTDIEAYVNALRVDQIPALLAATAKRLLVDHGLENKFEITAEERKRAETDKIGAIKAYRSRTGLGLGDSVAVFRQAGLTNIGGPILPGVTS